MRLGQNVLVNVTSTAPFIKVGKFGALVVTTPEQFAALLKSDAMRYGKISREANVRLD